MHTLRPYDEAIQLVLEQVSRLNDQETDLVDSLGRILAEEIFADCDLPPFDRAMMDGIALRASDTGNPPAELKIIGVANAGEPFEGRVESGQAIRIMTGAPVPPGADSVEMVEKVELTDRNTVVLNHAVTPGRHIAGKATYSKKGQCIFQPGTRIAPAHIGVLAGFGYTRVKIIRPPAVGIFSTGDELIDIDRIPVFGQVRDSNSYLLEALCRRLGLETERLGCLPDDLQETIKRDASSTFDMLILSGGVSMGERDFVHRAIRESGYAVAFHKAAVKPGKPVLFGKKHSRMVFGLPGNPVSSLVTFVLFVQPVVRKVMGYSQVLPVKQKARLLQPVQNRSNRRYYAPGQAVSAEIGLEVKPVKTEGSADLTSFSSANVLIVVPADVDEIVSGRLVEIILIDEIDME